GSVCGSIAHADPSAELPLVLVALEGSVTLSTRWRRRSVAAAQFFQGLMSTARRHDELIAAVSFPTARPGHGYAFCEFGRRHGDFAIVACAAVVTRSSTRLAGGGGADPPPAPGLGGLSDDNPAESPHEIAHYPEGPGGMRATPAL